MKTKILLSMLFAVITLTVIAQDWGKIITRTEDTIRCRILSESNETNKIEYKTKKMESFNASFDITGIVEVSKVKKIIYDNGKEIIFYRQEIKLEDSGAIMKKYNNYYRSKKSFWYRIGDGPGPGLQGKVVVGTYFPLTDTISRVYDYGLGGNVGIRYFSENCGFDFSAGVYTMKENKSAHGGESESRLTIAPLKLTVYLLFLEGKEWRPYIGAGGGCYFISQTVKGTRFSDSFFKEQDYDFGFHTTLGINYKCLILGVTYNNMAKTKKTRYLGFDIGFIF